MSSRGSGVKIQIFANCTFIGQDPDELAERVAHRITQRQRRYARGVA